MTFIATILAACNLPVRPASTPGIDQALAGTIVASTLEALRTKTPSQSMSDLSTPLPTTPFPSTIPTFVSTLAITPSPTATITPTYSVPMLNFAVNTNCREGPGTEYKVIIVLRSGQQAEAVGVQGNYCIAKNPNGEETCWVASDLASPSGSVWLLPTMTAPPLPTREPPPAPNWSKWNYECAYASGGSTMTMNLLWTDHATNETGYRVYRDGQVIASLGPDINSYIDVAFLESGKSFSYSVEVYSDAGQSSTSTISKACQ